LHFKFAAGVLAILLGVAQPTGLIGLEVSDSLTFSARPFETFKPLPPTAQNLTTEKILSARMADGMVLKVHYIDFALKSTHDPDYPRRVFGHMKMAYTVLKKQLKSDRSSLPLPRSIDLYLGDRNITGVLPYEGLPSKDFTHAPLFVIRTDPQTGEKTPAILMPANYSRFLKFWNQINHVPYGVWYRDDQYLANSVIHEMTHAFIHMFNENLGSTEHQMHKGDWYTEGLARYFESKIGSDASFASEGFQKRIGDTIQFSRGGANYYLRYPEETFFNLRYENALFWLYFEKRFGRDAIVNLSRSLKTVPFDATHAMYRDTIENVIEGPFSEMLDDYFNWVYKGGYKKYKEGKRLLPVARTKTLWSKGLFYLRSRAGHSFKEIPILDTDWVASWGENQAKGIQDHIAGDWTEKADIPALAFDVHEISVKRGETPKRIILQHHGNSAELKATVYLTAGGQRKVLQYTLAHDGRVEILTTPGESLTHIGLVLSNLDLTESSEYEIQIF